MKSNKKHFFHGHSRPFLARHAIAHASSSTHVKLFSSVKNCTSKSNFWLHVLTKLPVFYQDVCLFACDYYTDSCHWLLKWSYMNKYFDSESYWLLILYRNDKDFLDSPFYKHLKGIFAYRASHWRKPATRMQFFCKTNLVKEWMKKLNVLLTKEKKAKQWIGKWWPWFCELYTVYTMYIYSFSLLLNLFKERYINSVKSNKYMPFLQYFVRLKLVKN